LVEISMSLSAVSSGVRLKRSMAMQHQVKSALLRFLSRAKAPCRQRS